MSVSPVSASTPSASEIGEAKIGGRDVKNDHDKDDLPGASTASSTPLPSVNASGQPIGGNINASA